MTHAPRKFPLALQPAPDAPRGNAPSPSAAHPDAKNSTAAWLIPGDNPALWLAEMSRWKISLTKLRLFILPKSLAQPHPASRAINCSIATSLLPSPGTPGEGQGGGLVDQSAFDPHPSPPPEYQGRGIECLRPAGVLVLIQGEDSLDESLASPSVLPYRLFAGRLYLPANARLFPEVSPAELQPLLIHDILVFHPSAGLIGYSHADVVRAINLIAAPRRRDEIWDAAKAVPQTAPRLLCVESDSPPTLTTILDSSRDDIGSQADQTRDALSPTSASDFAARITGPLGRLLQWMTRGALGAAATARSGLDRLDQARRNELNRLLDLLEKNPDQGLQFAIPLGQPAVRGLARPTGKLSQRDANFNLGRLRGAAPADPWNVPWQVRQKLLIQYRAAGNRELSLGRHRRAAYIFAELLGDFSAAAHALRAGGHYRDAAALFRDPLRNHLAAAECLAEGNMLLEAVALYEEIKQWIRAGDLYEKLDRAPDARRCYRLAVHEYVTRNEFLPAAGLLEKKLGEAPEALQMLIGAWPGTDCAGICLAESFELTGRLAKHPEAIQRITDLAAQPPPARHVLGLAQALANVSRLYPDSAVRAAAADAARVVIGTHLAAHHANSGETATLLSTMTRLDPSDRLLARDATRYSSKTPPRPIPYPLAKPKSAAPTLLRSFHLPASHWHAAASLGEMFYALGNSGDGQRLLRGNFQGETQSINLFDCKKAKIYAAPRRLNLPSIIITTGNSGDIHCFSPMPANNKFAWPLVMTRPAWLAPSGVHCLCFNEQDTAFALENGDNPRINGFSLPSGRLMQTWNVPVSEGTPFMVAQKGHVFLAAGKKLWQIADTQILEFDLPHPATGLVASYAFTRLRIAVSMEQGVLVIWPDGGHQIVGELLADPVATFLKSGSLLAISRDDSRAYRTGDGKAVHIASFPGPAHSPIAILPTDEPNTFAVITTDGAVTIHTADFDR